MSLVVIEKTDEHNRGIANVGVGASAGGANFNIATEVKKTLTRQFKLLEYENAIRDFKTSHMTLTVIGLERIGDKYPLFFVDTPVHRGDQCIITEKQRILAEKDLIDPVQKTAYENNWNLSDPEVVKVISGKDVASKDDPGSLGCRQQGNPLHSDDKSNLNTVVAQVVPDTVYVDPSTVVAAQADTIFLPPAPAGLITPPRQQAGSSEKLEWVMIFGKYHQVYKSAGGGKKLVKISPNICQVICVR
jgi:hypothetical protein